MTRSGRSSLSLLTTLALACSTEAPPSGETSRVASAATSGSPSPLATAAETSSPASHASSPPAAAPPAESPAAARGGRPSGTGTAAEVLSTGAASAVAVEPASAPMVEGHRRTGAEYAAYLSGPQRAKVGAAVPLAAVFTASGRYHCNEKYPSVFKPDPAPEGISFAAEKFSGAAFGEKRSSIPVTLTASTGGTKTISGTLKFGVCDETECIPVKAQVAFTLAVE
ncbi:MAG: hypothetical protein FJ095_00010 [Deltaproteobacteria bacterium]|nr:hypothetical protein [Deltaproteobacteria bacterium]